MHRLLLAAATLLILSGCAHQVISPESMRLVDQTVSFGMLKGQPDQFRGRYVLVGGIIARVTNTSEGGEIEVVQFPLDEDGRPENSLDSGGRFLAQTQKFLDPLIFGPGLMVTLAGEVQGEKSRPLGNINYTYPLLSIRELYLWKPGEGYPTSPTFHFGFGVLHSF